MNSRIIVTTSWDDGHVLDLKLAQLLRKYDLPGTFYIAPSNQEISQSDRLTAQQIRTLDQSFEIGAHTITHPRLPQIDNIAAAREIAGSKSMLEAIVNHPVTTFCYPGGAYTPSHVAMVSDAGFTYGRTVERHRSDIGPNRLAAPTSVHAYRHWLDGLKIARLAKYHPLRTLNFLINWDSLAIAIFDETKRNGGVFHLWGHSWEIEQNGDWHRLERVLRHISGYQQADYVTNGAL